MPYNTRRKSLSLPSLGIQLPANSRALLPNRSLHTNTSTSATTTATATQDQPPSKKVKRSHVSVSSSSTSPPPPPATRVETQRPKSAPRYEDTPPPSPGPSTEVKIDTQGINDEVVTGVIEQLEKTGNKPQLVKELAAVLCNSLNVVESSANPQAIISSRLNAYLRRPWTALAPCPIAKTLIPTHPRRIYFYLTNTPHQPLPQSSSDSPLPSNRRSAVISPSLSSDEDAESRKRAALSPSPEVDLSVPDDLDDDGGPPTPAGSFSGRSSLARDGSHSSSGGGVEVMGHSHRAISPPLEGDEKEFTQTASVMQSKRSMSREQQQQNQGSLYHEGDTVLVSTEDETGEGARAPSVVTAEESEESAFARNSEAAAALFGHAQTMAAAAASGLSSPLVRPAAAAAAAGLHISTSSVLKRPAPAHGGLVELAAGDEGSLNLGLGWASDMISPEKVDLEELDDLFGDVF